MKRPWLSLVVPVYNEEDNLPEFLRRTLAILRGLGKSFEIVFVNDGSNDRSLSLLLEAQQREPEIVIIDFRRNFGQHSAVFAGFENVRGEHAITIDADLQNPPEEIPKVVAKLEEGFDCVGTVRLDRQDSLFRRTASRWINRLTRRLTGVALSDYGCMLRGYGKEVVEAMARTKEISTFIPALGASLAKKVCEIDVVHAPRTAGQSKYNFYKLVSLHFDLLTSFSLKPIRFLTFAGLAIALSALLFGVFLFVMRLVHGPEWAEHGVFTLFAILFFFVGAQFMVLGLLGEYVGRIYMEVRDRPRFIIRQIYRAGSPERQDAAVAAKS